jgi:hypothetical protein
MSAIGRRCHGGFRSFAVSVGMQPVWGRVVLGLEGEDARLSTGTAFTLLISLPVCYFD